MARQRIYLPTTSLASCERAFETLQLSVVPGLANQGYFRMELMEDRKERKCLLITFNTWRELFPIRIYFSFHYAQNQMVAKMHRLANQLHWGIGKVVFGIGALISLVMLLNGEAGWIPLCFFAFLELLLFACDIWRDHLIWNAVDTLVFTTLPCTR